MIITVALGVMLGVLAASVIGVCIVLDKRVLSWYMKKITDVTNELIKEQLNNMNEE